MGVFAEEDLSEYLARPPSAFRVLVLDDDDRDADLIVRACAQITEYAVRCVRARDAERARALLAGGRFDLVFADYWLGSETSVPLVLEIASGPQPCPVVMMSGSDTLEVQTIAHRAGALSFLPKSDVTRTSVRAAVHAAANRAAAAKAPPNLAEKVVREAEALVQALARLRAGPPSERDIEGLVTAASALRDDAAALGQLLLRSGSG